MLNVTLVSMPYAVLTMPSLGLAQLQAVVHSKMKSRVTVTLAHCYLDFAEFIGGVERYTKFGKYDGSGLSDWIFRTAAFDIPDNPDSFRDYFFLDGEFPSKKKMFELALKKRSQIVNFIDTLIERYDLRGKQVVGFTSLMSQNVSSFALARRLKQVHPEVITVFGGPNADHPMGKTIAQNIPQIDYVFSGEALVSFPEFLGAVEANNLSKVRLIKGIHSRFFVESAQSFDGERGAASVNTVGTDCRLTLPVVSGQQDQAKTRVSQKHMDNSGDPFELDEMPLLDYSEYHDRLKKLSFRAQIERQLILPFQTSTGCWKADRNPCSFCGMTPYPSRKMTVEKARAYINSMIEMYKGKFFLFEAADANMPIEYFDQVLPYVNQGKDVILQYEVTSRLRPNEIAQFVNANVILPQPGIESLSTKTLKIMRKGVNAFQNIQFLKRCAENGLYPVWNYLYGFPEESYDELDNDKLLNDIQTILHLPPPASYIPIGFTRFGQYFNNQDKYGLKLQTLPRYGVIYPFEESVIADLAYFFFDQQFLLNLFSKHSQTLRARNLEIVCWMNKFREAVPELCFTSDKTISDTRYEKPLKHRLCEKELGILRYLNDPHSAEDVAAEFKLAKDEVQKNIDQFMKRRFLFSEGDKYLNVVCDRTGLTTQDYNNYYIRFVENASL